MKLTRQQEEVIKTNLAAFITNFGEPRIVRVPYGGGFNVYFPADSTAYIQYCPNINYLNGWLYGCVQGYMRGEFKQEDRNG